MPDIDLPPHEWKSEREKPSEPFFGRGWPIGAAVLVGIFTAAYFADGSGHIPIWASLASSVGTWVALELFSALQR